MLNHGSLHDFLRNRTELQLSQIKSFGINDSFHIWSGPEIFWTDALSSITVHQLQALKPIHICLRARYDKQYPREVLQKA